MDQQNDAVSTTRFETSVVPLGIFYAVVTIIAVALISFPIQKVWLGQHIDIFSIAFCAGAILILCSVMYVTFDSVYKIDVTGEGRLIATSIGKRYDIPLIDVKYFKMHVEDNEGISRTGIVGHSHGEIGTLSLTEDKFSEIRRFFISISIQHPHIALHEESLSSNVVIEEEQPPPLGRLHETLSDQQGGSLRHPDL